MLLNAGYSCETLLGSSGGAKVSNPLSGGVQRRCVDNTIKPHSAAPPAIVNTDLKAMLLFDHPIL